MSIARCTKGTACAASDFAGVAEIGATQVNDEASLVHAPWMLDPALTGNLLAGTCRVWRGPAANGGVWSSADELSVPFGATASGVCGASAPVVQSLAAGGPASGVTSGANAGSTVLYAGLAGADTAGGSLGGHLFATAKGATDTNATLWTDAALGKVTNDAGDAEVFNPGRFNVSWVAADPHDVTGGTVYATVMGFGVPHLYRSVNAGGQWLNVSGNLPDAPANSVLVDPNDANTVYVALDTGVYVTTAVTACSTANCWSVYGTSLPNAPAISLEAAVGMATGDGRLGELRVGTYGRGIWEIPLLTAISPAAPAMTLSPTSLTFASEPVGTASAAQTVTVTNTGSAALNLTSVVASGDFSETDSCVGAPVGVGSSCTVQVTFLPSATGARTGLLTVYGNVAGGQATATLAGTGLAAPAVSLSPTALTFGSTMVGTTSAAQNVAVSNTGGAAVSLTTITVTGDFRVSANTCSLSLPAATACTVAVVFAPTASGPRSGTLTVVDSAGTQSASLTGGGVTAATDTLSPLSLTFAAQQLNTTSATQTVTLTNTGGVALTLIGATIASGDFTAVNGCGTSLNPNSSCAISVAYAPKSVGAETGSLTVTDEYRSQSVALSGTGVAPPGVSLSPVGGLAFSATAVGATSPAQTVTLTDNGGLPLAIAGVAVTGDFTGGASTCGATLAAGTACTVQVAFVPSAGGTRTGTLTFTDNASGSPQTLPLSGAGIDFSLTATSATSVTVASGSAAEYTLALASVAGVTGTAALTCTGAPAHAVCVVAPSSAALGGTTDVTVTVSTGLAALTPPLWPGLAGPVILWVGALPLLLFGRRRRLRYPAALLALAVIAGCGADRLIPASTLPGTGASTPTPSGSYTITVSAASAGIARSVGLTLVVP